MLTSNNSAMAIENSIASGKALNGVTASTKYATNGVNLVK